MAQESRLAIVIDSRNARQQIDQLRNSLSGLNDAGGEATVNVRGLGTAARAAGSAIAALGVGAVAREVLRLTDSFKSMQGSLALVSTSTANANESFQKLLAMANNTGSSLESTVSLYTRLANATRGAGFSQDQLLNVTDALNKAFVISGATMQEASNAAIQLSQGLASGTLRGEELNSVMEQGPRITRALADYLGVTNGQIRQMAADGKITSDVVTNALLQSLSSLNSELDKMPRRFEQASTALKNNFLAAIGQINVDPVVSSVDALAKSLAQPDVVIGIQRIANGLGSIVAVGGDGLKAVAENTDVLIAVAGAYATKVGVGLVSSLALSAKARLADTAAANQQLVASRQAELAAASEAVAIHSVTIASAEASLARAIYARSEAMAATQSELASVKQLKAVATQLAADRQLEIQRMQAQITNTGLTASHTRLAEIRTAEAGIATQLAAAEGRLAASRQAELATGAVVGQQTVALNAARTEGAAILGAQATAQNALNAAEQRGVAVRTAGSAALAAFGGPLGLITLGLSAAAGAAIYFASGTDTATKALIDQNLTLDDSISKFKQLSAEQQRFQSAKWMEAQRDATKNANRALDEYFTRAFDGLNSLGASGVESADTFKRMFEEVRNGQRSLDSLTAWLTSNTQISSAYRDELVRIGAEYSTGSQKADDYARLLERSKTATDGAASSATSLASAQQASAAAVGGGAQAWEKYISQLTQTRDLVGANTAQEAAYTAAKAGFNSQQVEYARLIGEQTDLIKKYEEAVKDGKKADQERLSSQLLVSIKSSEALRIQMEAQGKAMNKMAENAEESSKRQITAMQQAANFAVASAARMVSPLSAPQQNRQGASLLMLGQPQADTKPGASQAKTPEQQLREMLDRVDGNTATKANTPKAEKGLSSKLNEAQTAFDNLYKAAQPAKFALQEYVERQSQLELLLLKGKITQEQYNEALAQSSINYAAAIKGASGLTAAEQYRAQVQKRLANEQEGYRVEAASVGMGDLQADRYRQRVQLERDANNEILGLRDNLALAENEKQRVAIREQIKILEDSKPARLAALEAGFAQKDQQMGNPLNGWTAALQNFQAGAQNVAGQTEAMFTGAFNNMTTGVGSAFERMAFDGQTFGESITQITRSMAGGVVNALGQMAAQWVATKAVQMAFGTAEEAAHAKSMAMVAAETSAKVGSEAAITTAKVTGTATAESVSLASLAKTTAANIAAAAETMASWLPAALVASVGSFGAAAIVGGGALLAAFALTRAFKDGGYVSGPGGGRTDSIPARLSNGEFVVNAQATKRNRSLLEAINSGERVSVSGQSISVNKVSGSGEQVQGAQQTNVYVSLVEDQGRAGTVRQSTRDDGSTQIDAFVADIWGGGERAQTLEAAYGLKRAAG